MGYFILAYKEKLQIFILEFINEISFFILGESAKLQKSQKTALSLLVI
jgi:hypothetical protein